MQVTVLNVMKVVMQYYTKAKVEDYAKKFVESAQSTLYCKWPNKEAYSPQKNPYIIEALCKFCSLLKQKTPVCIPNLMNNYGG